MKKLFKRIFRRSLFVPQQTNLEERLERAELVYKRFEEYRQRNAPLGAFTSLELREWLKNPTTKKMIRVFKNLRLGISDGIAQGSCTKDTLPVMIGKCQGIKEITEIMEDIQGQDRKEHLAEILSLYLFNINNEEK